MFPADSLCLSSSCTPSGAKRTEPNFSNNLGCDDETPTREVLAISLFHR